MRFLSPLKYPGGKVKLLPFFEDLVAESGMESPVYVEPYAGGAAVGLGLLLHELVDEIHINDASRAIYAFWHSVLHETKSFLRLVESTPVTMEQWGAQRAVLASPDSRDLLELGFAVFFINRTSRSGIIGSGGVIGGNKQLGKYKLDARFNKPELMNRIRAHRKL